MPFRAIVSIILSSVNLNDGGKGHYWGEDFGNSYKRLQHQQLRQPCSNWEVAEKANFGMELGLFDECQYPVDYFTENRTNIYMQRGYIPASMGLTAIPQSNI